MAKARLFGSVARGEETPESDLDIMVKMKNNKKYLMFNLPDISFIIEKKINRKVDLAEKDCLKDFALKTASADLFKIYG